jgi:hypothetical protein
VGAKSRDQRGANRFMHVLGSHIIEESRSIDRRAVEYLRAPSYR